MGHPNIHSNKLLFVNYYYCDHTCCAKQGHITRTAGWLPPIENWVQTNDLPYGWEKAIDQKGQPYYINHLNKTTTYEEPIRHHGNDSPPEPRVVILQRSPTLGFGFVAGSEKPVIVRFVTEGGPSVNKLEPGDQILAVNGEDVKDAPRDHVIQLVRNCETSVTLLVCQPQLYNAVGRKSTLLSAGKKAKLKSRPIRVRFAESVCVNGAPLFPPSAFSLGDLCVPPMANVLKVFLENGQTKSFKYDSTTTVQNVVTSLRDKLCLTAGEHFSLVVEHVKSLKRNKLTLLDPQETVARIAARPGAHKLRCLFRVTFVPVSAAGLAQKDLNALDYLFLQCCNDVTQERFAPELQPEVALRLAALHMHQHALANNISPAKLTVKTVEREFGLDRFVPASLIEGMKRKELRRLLGHFLKLNSQMTGSSTKMLTQLQAKIHYLDIISGLPSYGAKCFSTNQRDGVERVLLVSPRFGLSQIAGVRNTVPQPICNLEELIRVVVTRDDDISNTVTVFITPDRVINFSMEDRDASEFAIVLAGYYRLMAGKELPLEQERDVQIEDIAPPYLSQHTVVSNGWSYLPTEKQTHSIAFLMPPPYHSTGFRSATGSISSSSRSDECDRNANSARMSNRNVRPSLKEYDFETAQKQGKDARVSKDGTMVGGVGRLPGGIPEARNEEVLRRVAEMQKLVENSERYLNEHGDYGHEFEVKPGGKLNFWRETSVDVDESDCESLNSSKQSSTEDGPGVLKHSDSLTLLTETINQGLDGIAKGLSSIYTAPFSELNGKLDHGGSGSAQNTPKSQRKISGLSQILSDLQALGNDLSQSESDSESLYTPNSSPIHKTQVNQSLQQQQQQQQQMQNSTQRNKSIRTSFGLHSPDSATDGRDMNLKDYLRQLKEASSASELGSDGTDLAAKKLGDLYGYELLGDDAIIETDPDIIDLRSIPPPQTPDELDNLHVLSVPPSGFDDRAGKPSGPIAAATDAVSSTGDLEEFLKQSEQQKSTEPPNLALPPKPCPHTAANQPSPPQRPPKSAELQLRLGSPVRSPPYYARMNGMAGTGNYYEMDPPSLPPRFEQSPTPPPSVILATQLPKKPPLPPVPLKPCLLRSPVPILKNPHAQTFNHHQQHFQHHLQHYQHHPAHSTPPPHLPHHLQHHPHHPSAAGGGSLSANSSPVRTAGIGSPHFHRNPNCYREIERAFNHHRDDLGAGQTTQMTPAPTTGTTTTTTTSTTMQQDNKHQLQPQPPNGHHRSHSDCPPVCLKNPPADSRAQLTLLCSPQMSRKASLPTATGPPAPTGNVTFSNPGSPILSNKNGHVLNVDTLMAKTDVAMAGLLVKLDQVAALCSAAQTAGGGSSIDEDRFQQAKDELTDQSLQLVTASKHLVVSMSDANLTNLPEHLTACLSALRRITELAQDLTRYTSAPLQTRNIVLKIHDVASSFRELACVRVGPAGAGQLALNAECLANVLATLLRSLRVFSP
ncbi:AGAP003128-PA-like protein [Anopheles sinensis]|uniref:AGAP003128-PA-like protein n=1 Tax=Anopheles sinensis TaxID=74873 RepID=A0A084VZW6_ANOSI|nr:AGAP003128-PA-like protein [Anopheles sinensis]